MKMIGLLALIFGVTVIPNFSEALYFPPITFPNEVVFGEDEIFLSSSIENKPSQPEVVIPQGKQNIHIIGKYSDDESARVFGSIPYAKPPVGDLRWQDPKDPEISDGKIEATKLPNMCPQSCKAFGCPTPRDEDCLYLNVYAPLEPNPETPYPVMVSIHGGAFVIGTSTYRVFNGEYIASTTGTILVTINYRLGVLGFLNYEDPNDGKTIDGNFGMKDQMKAMKWVKENIKFFGGDADKITILGQSAGAASVAIHMTNQDSAKLFNRAIIQSEPFSIEYLKVPKARELGEKFAKSLKCKTISCLKDKSVEDILKKQDIMTGSLLVSSKFKTKFQVLMAWAPVVDGDILKDQPVKVFASNSLAANVPYMIGTTTNEGRSLALPILDTPLFTCFNKFQYNIAVGIFYKNLRKEVVKKYPGTGCPVLFCLPPKCIKSNKDMFSKLFTDYLIVCPTRHVLHKKKSDKDVWVYIFDQPNAHPRKPSDCAGYSCHGDEMPYVYHTLEKYVNSPTDEEKILQEIMNRHWVNFAHNADPNIPYDNTADTHTGSLTSYLKAKQEQSQQIQLSKWPEFTKSKKIMVYNTADGNVPQIVDHYPQEDKCEFFDKLIPDYGLCAENDC